jgi:hypothetical protein
MGINRFIYRGTISSYGCKISWTDSGTLVVTCFAGERLSTATVTIHAGEEVSMIEVTMRNGLSIVP